MDICHKGMKFEEDGRVFCLACGHTYHDKPSITDSLIARLREFPIPPAKRGRPRKVVIDHKVLG